MKGEKVILDRVDIFATKMPQFNLEGKTQISSHLGCVASIFLVLIIVTYSLQQFIMLASPGNTMVFSHVKHNGRSLNERKDLSKHNFALAFSVDRFVVGGSELVEASHPDLTEWSVFMEEKDLDGKTYL